MIRINNRVFRLKEDTTLPNKLTFLKGTEFEVVRDVVYMSGYPLPPTMQAPFLTWIIDNPNLFLDDTRKW